jgi:signal transduction histidine kinase
MDSALQFAALEVDRDGLIIGWSAAAELMFGQSLAQMADRRLSTLLDGADPAQLIHALPEASARATFKQGILCRRKNGDTFQASLMMTEIDRADGSAPRLAVFIINDEDDRCRDQFLAAVAHDLRQPISVIETASYLLERKESAPGPQKMLARIKSAAAQLHELSAELLDFGSARLGGEILLEREHMNLIDVVDEVCGALKLTHAQRMISIEGADAIAGHWDRRRLRRVAQNLIENACAHSPPASTVSITCQRSGGDVVLTVQNECSAAPVAILDDLFEPFRRASVHGRAGLGLYIARALARAHGGDVNASWNAGVITFTVTLPILVARRSEALGASETLAPFFSTQRRHRRAPFDTELEVGVGDQLFRARGRDVSLRGLAFWSDVDLKVDERVQVGVSMGPTSFRVLGTVRHVNRGTGGAVVGIEFPCDLSQAEIDLLRKPLRS